MLAWFSNWALSQQGSRKSVGCSDRKLRLFATACVRQAWGQLSTDQKARVVFAEKEPFAQTTNSVHAEYASQDSITSYVFSLSKERSIAYAVGWLGAENALEVAEQAPAWLQLLVPFQIQAQLLRDIFGNPFRPYHVRWAGGPIPSLANAAYENRDPQTGCLDTFRLSLLADALEEAGCPQTEKVLTLMGDDCLACGGKCVHSGLGRAEAIECVPCRRVWLNGEHYLWPQPHPLLAHLRSTGPHVRGCWALDLVLGKE
jgi:hypothetical protein